MAEGSADENKSGRVPDVFISYASQDAATADAVVAALEGDGIKCWVAPRDVTPGTFYADEIVHAIDAAKATVLILSQNAAASPHVLREVERAASKRHPVLPLRIDKAPLPAGLEYFLNTSQWLDASSGEMVRALPKLVAAVRLAIQASGVTPSVAPRPLPARPVSPVPPRRIGIIVASVMGLGLAVFAVDRLWLSHRPMPTLPGPTQVAPARASSPGGSTIPDKSIAVLRFADMSEKHDQEYFADGMAEEILDLLTRIPGLTVIGRTSSFQFKEVDEDLRTIGTKLNVAYALEGSVRKSDNRVRVTAQLLETGAGRRLWSDSYDGEIGDVLALQAQIASSIARALQLAVGAEDAELLRRLNNPEAYALYLRGRSAYDRGTDDDLHAAEADFEQVLALEPTFSRAAEGLVLTRLGMIGSGSSTSEGGWPRAMEAANLALRLDPKSSLAHLIIGLKLATYDFDWAGASRELEAATATNPRDPVVLYNCAWLAFDLGRDDDAVHFQDASLSLDPLNPDSLQNGAVIQYLLGHLDAAERGFRQSLAVSPGYGGNHRYLGRILLLRGKPKEALREMQAETPLLRDVGLALAYDALGRRAESDAALAREKRAHGDASATEIAEVYAYRHDLDHAFEWLNRAVANHALSLGHKLTHDPMLQPLRTDPRYTALLREVGRSQ
jgi:TolB-like protein